MRFTVDADVLERILGPVVKASSSNKTLQILTHIYFRVSEDSVEVIGANPEYSVRVREKVNVERTGEFLVLGDKFFQIVKALPQNYVVIEEEKGGSILVKSLGKEVSFLLQTIPTQEYPKQILESVGTSYEFEVSQGEMKRIIKKLVKFCSDDDTLQAVFTGFLFDLKNTGKYAVVTTDTKRMGVFYSSYRSEDEGVDVRFVVPSGSLEILSETLSDEGPLRIGLNYDEDKVVRNVVFKTPSTVVSSTVISGTFPNYEAVIPGDMANYALVNKDDLKEALKRVSIIADRETNRVVFLFDSESITVRAENSILGQASEVVPCKFFGSSEYICFNYEFILEYLSVLEADEFYWGFNHYESGNKFWSEGEREFVYIAMPLRRS